MLRAGFDQHEADSHRIRVGFVAYCPICARELVADAGPIEWSRTVAEHVDRDHDPILGNLLRLALSVAPPVPPAIAPDSPYWRPFG